MAHSALTVSPEAMAYFKELKAKGKIKGDYLDKLTVADLEVPHEDHPLTSAEVADLAKVSTDWVRKLAPEMPMRIARKIGGEWRFKDAAARFILDRPDRRGRRKTQLSAEEMAESARRNALFHTTGEVTDSIGGVLIWNGRIVATAWGEILEPTGDEHELRGWGQIDGPAAGYQLLCGIVWVPKRYLKDSE